METGTLTGSDVAVMCKLWTQLLQFWVNRWFEHVFWVLEMSCEDLETFSVNLVMSTEKFHSFASIRDPKYSNTTVELKFLATSSTIGDVGTTVTDFVTTLLHHHAELLKLYSI